MDFFVETVQQHSCLALFQQRMTISGVPCGAGAGQLYSACKINNCTGQLLFTFYIADLIIGNVLHGIELTLSDVGQFPECLMENDSFIQLLSIISWQGPPTSRWGLTFGNVRMSWGWEVCVSKWGMAPTKYLSWVRSFTCVCTFQEVSEPVVRLFKQLCYQIHKHCDSRIERNFQSCAHWPGVSFVLRISQQKFSNPYVSLKDALCTALLQPSICISAFPLTQEQALPSLPWLDDKVFCFCCGRINFATWNALKSGNS